MKCINNDVFKLVTSIQNILISNSDSKTKNSGERYFKEKILSHGVSVSLVTKISKEIYSEIKNLSKNEIFDICTKLWKTGYIEESFIACNLSYYISERYVRDDFITFEIWQNKFVNNWASCDTLCNHTVATLIEMYPVLINKLIDWTKSDNMWVRRGAAVTLIIPARKGKFLNEIFCIADNLLNDKEDLVLKGYGWMLKAASEYYQQEVFNYVMKNKKEMPRVSLRYAIEKMPENLRKEAMKK